MNASPPRVLHVVLALDPGGTERLVLEIVKRLHPRYPTAVCCLDRPGAWAGELHATGVRVTALGRQPGFHPSLARRIARAIDELRATVLHCHHYSPFVYGRLGALLRPGTRIVFTEHGRLSDAPPSPKRRLVNRFLTIGQRDLFAVSHDLRRYLLDEGFPTRMGVIWNGIEPGPTPGDEARQAARAALGLGDELRVIGSIGRLDPVKDFVTLITAFAAAHAEDPRLRLVLMGDGPERARLEECAAGAGVTEAVRFLGHRDDVRRLLAGVDIYTNSSTSEGISLTLLEAMAAERPIVATKVGGTPEVVVDGETGVLVPARAPHDLARSLATLAAAPDRARAMGQAGRRRVLEHFTLERMVEHYARLYEGRRDPAA